MASEGLVYDLSSLTRDKSADRRITWRGWDMPRRVFWMLVATSVFQVPLVALMYPWLGIYCVIPALILYALVYYLFESRTTDDLRLRRYRALYDSRRSNTGRFLMCNAEIHPGSMRIRLIRSASVSTFRPEVEPAPEPEVF